MLKTFYKVAKKSKSAYFTGVIGGILASFCMPALPGLAATVYIDIFEIKKTITIITPPNFLEIIQEKDLTQVDETILSGLIKLEKGSFIIDPPGAPLSKEVSHVGFGYYINNTLFAKLFHMGFARSEDFPEKLLGFKELGFSDSGTMEYEFQTLGGNTYTFNGQVPVQYLPIQEAFDMIPDVPEYQELRNSIAVSEGGFVPVMMTPVPEKTSTNALITLGIVGTASILKRELKLSK